MATPAGRLLSETKDDAATVYTYYKTGELKTATDAENNTTTYSYDNKLHTGDVFVYEIVYEIR